jgi:hypothetical protein
MAEERLAEAGELCTCGRPARLVFITEKSGGGRLVRLVRRRPARPMPFLR